MNTDEALKKCGGGEKVLVVGAPGETFRCGSRDFWYRRKPRGAADCKPEKMKRKTALYPLHSARPASQRRLHTPAGYLVILDHHQYVFDYHDGALLVHGGCGWVTAIPISCMARLPMAPPHSCSRRSQLPHRVALLGMIDKPR